MIDPLGRTWTYTYCQPPSSTCSAGDLVSVHRPADRGVSHVTSYTYDQGELEPRALVHDLVTVTHPNGQPGGLYAGKQLVNAYNSAGQVTSQTTPNGNATTFNYCEPGPVSGNGYTLVTDPDGNNHPVRLPTGRLVATDCGLRLSVPLDLDVSV